jgi:tricorn protease
MRPLLLLFCSVTLVLQASAAEPGYYRQPAIHNGTIVFVAEGDLWSVPLAGGSASRLTNHTAAEGTPAISPDGKSLAFTARYEGPAEVYVMPLTGGRPRRLTFDGARLSHVGWTADGKVLIGTNAHAGLPAQQLVALDLDAREGLSRTRIPLAQAADGSYSPDGKTLFFTRGSRSKGATPSGIRAARHSNSGRSKRAMPRRGRSPPITPAPANRRWFGAGASTSPRTATAR